VVDGERHEEGKSPAAADSCASEDAVGGAALENEAGAEDDEAEREADGALACGPESAELVAEEEGQADDQRNDAEFVEPVLSEPLFDRN
jgi:hypothetical protein